MSRESVMVDGVLEVHPRGHGYLRNPARNYASQPNDPYVAGHLIGKLRLQTGTHLSGRIDSKHSGGPRLASVEAIEGDDPENYHPRKFDQLTPIDPWEWLRLETGPQLLTTRVMDLLTPVGRGQRGLIVAPPRSGKTVLLQQVALAIAQNYPDMRIIMLLIDERPEEVTDMRRTCQGAEVFASSSDRQVAEHVRLAELVLERSKRLAEQGKHAFLLLDSLTRLARAYNKQVGSSGRTMSGGIDIRALDMPKRLFGQARAFDEGGSLTVLGTALIETGSRMDDVIFEEFKGTGNMELVLDRRLAERRVFPALDIQKSGTRKEERLLPPEDLRHINLLRRSLAPLHPIAAMEALVKVLSRYPSNADFLQHVSEFSR